MAQVAASPDIVGVWRLKSFEVRRDDGPTIYRFVGAEGSVIYSASGRMSAQVMRLIRTPIDAGDQMEETPDEPEGNLEGQMPAKKILRTVGAGIVAYQGKFELVVSYQGSYELDEAGGFVVNRVERSLFANWEGQEHKRFLTLEGEMLTLSTPPTPWGSGELVAVLQWERRGEVKG